MRADKTKHKNTQPKKKTKQKRTILVKTKVIDALNMFCLIVQKDLDILVFSEIAFNFFVAKSTLTCNGETYACLAVLTIFAGFPTIRKIIITKMGYLSFPAL